ncbi:signal peptidase II [Acidobacteriia bacterium AH_259_A11_L15]|nr:signal peptidase II [Acidobacteriia bacterium AH_259_A11_L15]
MSLRSRTLYLLLALAIFLLDQASKALVARTLAVGELRRVIPGFFNLTHTRNPGAAFGLLSNSDSPWTVAFLILVSVAALALVWSLLWRGPARLAGVGLGLILGGALGNLFDRLQAGSVVDFLDFHVGGYHWPAFNLADSAIVVGAAALLAEVLRSRRRAPSEG